MSTTLTVPDSIAGALGTTAGRVSDLELLVANLQQLNASLQGQVAASAKPFYPVWASVSQNPNEPYLDACIRTINGLGFRGIFRYYGPGKAYTWDTVFAGLADRYGHEPLSIVLSPKTMDWTALKALLTKVPDAWRPYFYFCPWQEPEDDDLTAASVATFKSWFPTAADICHGNGCKVMLEVQEWALDPANKSGWQPEAAFVDAPHIDLVGWSIMEYAQRLGRIPAQLGRVASFMANYETPWAVASSVYTTPTTGATDAQKRAQAEWLRKLFTVAKLLGAEGLGWFNLPYSQGEGRIELNSYAVTALDNVLLTLTA